MFEAHDALLCIAGGSYIGEAERRRVSPENCFKSAEEMRALFADCRRPSTTRWSSPAAAPSCPARASRSCRRSRWRTAARRPRSCARRAVDGLEHRLAYQVWTPEMDEAARAQAAKPYRQRLEFELEMIEQTGFPGYFLIVADFIQWAKSQGIPVGPGRGSGAGSVVAWSLTITDLDPLRWGLLFERFLNPERVSMPDFDIDFCETRRDEVIKLRPAEIRQRARGADHHLRHAEGAGGAARRGPRAADAVRPGRPHLQDGAEQPGQSGHAAAGDRGRAAAAADAGAGRGGRRG